MKAARPDGRAPSLHTIHAYDLYQDGVKGARQTPVQEAFRRIPALDLCLVDGNRLDGAARKTLNGLIEDSEEAFLKLYRQLPASKFSRTLLHVLNLIQDGLGYLRALLCGGVPDPHLYRPLVGLWDKITLRIKKLDFLEARST